MQPVRWQDGMNSTAGVGVVLVTTRKPGVPAIFVNISTQRSYPAAGVMGEKAMQDTRWNGIDVAEIR